ncbi:hypothetical protein [Methylobacterium sp. A52T]
MLLRNLVCQITNIDYAAHAWGAQIEPEKPAFSLSHAQKCKPDRLGEVLDAPNMFRSASTLARD